jgi:hypothetical protein
MNNSNNNSKNNISNIENDNSNNNIDSGEISDEYNNSFILSEKKISNTKKPKFYYPKVKKTNFKNNYDDIMTEKKVDFEDDDEDIDNGNSKSSNNIEKENKQNKNVKKFNLKSYKNIKNSHSKGLKENKKKPETETNNITEDLDENNVYKDISLKDGNNKSKEPQITHNKNKTSNNKTYNYNVAKSQRINNTNKRNEEIKTKLLKSLNTYKNNNKITEENTNVKNEKKINKKVKYVLKKMEEPKNLSKEEKRELAIKEIFNYYSSQNFVLENKKSTFDKIQNKTGHLSLNEYCRFCNDFRIPLTKDRIFSLFNKSIATSSKSMTFQEFKISLISMGFAIKDFKIEEINRSINIFIGKVKKKNKEKSRFEPYNETEVNQNKEIIKKKMEEIEEIQKKSENEIIEALFKFLEIDDRNKYINKMKGIYNGNKKNEVNLPKIHKNENNKINNKSNFNSKSTSVLTYNKKDDNNSVAELKKFNLGNQLWAKDMVEKNKDDSPKRDRIIYVLSEEDSDEEKDNNLPNVPNVPNLPVIESSGIPLFSKKKSN